MKIRKIRKYDKEDKEERKYGQVMAYATAEKMGIARKRRKIFAGVC